MSLRRVLRVAAWVAAVVGAVLLALTFVMSRWWWDL